MKRVIKVGEGRYLVYRADIDRWVLRRIVDK
jgi:hypothetical protein